MEYFRIALPYLYAYRMNKRSMIKSTLSESDWFNTLKAPLKKVVYKVNKTKISLFEKYKRELRKAKKSGNNQK